MWLIKEPRAAVLGLAMLLAATGAAGCLPSGGISLNQGSLNVSLSGLSASNLPSSKITSGTMSITIGSRPSGAPSTSR